MSNGNTLGLLGTVGRKYTREGSIMLDDGIFRLLEIHYCEYCGRPDSGTSRCPHAINHKLDCPNNRQATKALANRLRRLGR